MKDLNDLLARIDAEATLHHERQTRLQREQLNAFAQRERRYRESFLPVMARLREIWVPRLELLTEKTRSLAERFGESIMPSPTMWPTAIEPHSNEATLECSSRLAQIGLTIGFYHDTDVRSVMFCYKLRIIPVFVKFESESRLEQALDSFHDSDVAQWLDDRIVNFVQTYLAIHENSTYLADQMVEDPVAHARFPRFAAQSVLQRNGDTYYFIGPETKRVFEHRLLQPAGT